MDVRGQEGRSQDLGQFEGLTVKGQVIRGKLQGPKHFFYKDVYLDVYQMIQLVARLDFVDETRLMSYGASQGGALALVAARTCDLPPPRNAIRRFGIHIQQIANRIAQLTECAAGPLLL